MDEITLLQHIWSRKSQRPSGEPEEESPTTLTTSEKEHVIRLETEPMFSENKLLPISENQVRDQVEDHIEENLEAEIIEDQLQADNSGRVVE